MSFGPIKPGEGLGSGQARVLITQPLNGQD